MLGEGVTWSARRKALLWVDILNPMVFEMDLASRRVRRWKMPELICWIIERQGRDDFIVGLKSGFAQLSLEPFKITPIGSPEPDLPRNRLNDAKVDAWGRIWAGTMTEGGRSDGALYRIDPDLTWSRQDTGYKVANGPTFSPDGRTMYHADTPRGLVYAMDLGAGGALTNKRLFVRFEADWGSPDGMTTDAEGGVWICHWGGARISRFLPDGRLDRSIAFPATRMTDCVFAGPGLDVLFASSASVGMADEPGAGRLYEVRPGVRGLPARLFAG